MFSHFACNDRKKRNLRCFENLNHFDLISAIVHDVFNRTKNRKVNLRLYCVMKNITKI